MSTLSELDFGRVEACGRQEELKQLRQSLDRAEAGSCEVILVEGQSGAGKSFLVNTFLSRTSHRKLLVCRGKYDKDSKDPLDTLGMCLESMVTDLLADSTKDWKAHAKQVLGAAELRILASIAPIFLDVAGREDDDNIVTNSSASVNTSTTTSEAQSSWNFQRLRLAVRSFLRMVCEHKTVVFVQDDVQWVDETSLDIIKAIVFDKHAKNMLFIATHRCEIEDMNMVSELKTKAPKDCVTVLTLGNLDLQAVTDVVSNLTRRDESECKDFALVLARRTGGNAFFLVHFLRVLDEKGILYYSFSKYQWEWDVDRIVSETDIADNVLDIVADKIKELPEDLQYPLKSAACLGPSQFDIHILSKAMQSRNPDSENTPMEAPDHDCEERTGTDERPLEESAQHAVDETQLAANLDRAVKEGLLDMLETPGKYKFAHDKIRESTCALLPSGVDRSLLHLTIGRNLKELCTSMTGNDDETQGCNRLLLLAVHHLNLGSSAISDSNERIELAKMNYEAAQLSLQRSCFIPASNCLKTGLSMLSEEERWKEHYDVTLKLCTTLAHVLYCSGKLDESEAVVKDILGNTECLTDQLDAYRSLIMCKQQSGCHKEAMDITMRLLRKLGVPFPRRPFIKLVLFKQLVKIRGLLRRLSDEELLNSHEASENDIPLWAFTQLLGEMAVSIGDMEVGATAWSFLFLLTLERGYTMYSALSFAICASMFGRFGDYISAARYGDIAAKLAAEDTSNPKNAQASLLVNFLTRHLSKPLPDCLDPIVRAKRTIVDAGAVEALFMSVAVYSFTYYHSGLKLGPLDQDMTKFAELLNDYGQRTGLSIIECHMQFVKNIMGKSEDPLVLTGDVMDQESNLKYYSETKNERALQSMYIHQMILAFYFDDLKLANDMSSKLFRPVKEGPTPVLPVLFMFQGLIAFSLAISTGRWKHIRRGRSFLKRLENMLQKGCINVHHMVLILQAENLSLRGKVEPVQDAYDDAIRATGKLGLTHNQALANERAGMFFLRKDDRVWASTYLSRAWALYHSWGAVAKSDQLEKKHGNLIDKGEMSSVAGGSSLKARSRFDDLSTNQKITLVA